MPHQGALNRWVITSTHGEMKKIKEAYARINAFFSELKATATQLTDTECWHQIVTQSMMFFIGNSEQNDLSLLPQPT